MGTRESRAAWSIAATFFAGSHRRPVVRTVSLACPVHCGSDRPLHATVISRPDPYALTTERANERLGTTTLSARASPAPVRRAPQARSSDRGIGLSACHQ